jgi:hypothetical protein
MTIYQNDADIVFRLDTGIDNLNAATKIQILVRKPSGLEVEWTASQYGTTSYITYTSLLGDLDEAGDYVLQAYIEMGESHPHSGDSVNVTVYGRTTSRVNVSQLIRYFSIYYKNISVQTFSQYNENPQGGTTAEILYDDIDVYSDVAVDELENILVSRNIVLTNAQRYVALCHLVADYFEMTNPDWNFRSENMGSGVSFSRGEKTGPREALDKLLDVVEKATRMARRPHVRMGAEALVKIKDHTNYPRRFKKTGIPAFDVTDGGYDSEEVPDLGNYNDPLY